MSSQSQADPLPQGWTQHVAPSGHYYYYNKTTKESSYERPKATNGSIQAEPPKSGKPSPAAVTGPQPKKQQQSRSSSQSHEHASWAAAYTPGYETAKRRNDHKPRKKEVPKLQRPLSLEPWSLVVTNLGRPFVYNRQEKTSFWMPPPDVKNALDLIPKDEIVMLIARCRGLKNPKDGSRPVDKETTNESKRTAIEDEMEYMIPPDDEFVENELIEPEGSASISTGIIRQRNRTPSDASSSDSGSSDDEYGSSDDDESNSDSDSENNSNPDGPVEFNEDDIEWQIQAMMAENNDEDDKEEEDLPYDVKVEQFKQMLLELKVNPYSSWDNEFNKLINDPRYTLLQTSSERIAVFQDWARDRIVKLKEQQAVEPKITVH